LGSVAQRSVSLGGTKRCGDEAAKHGEICVLVVVVVGQAWKKKRHILSPRGKIAPALVWPATQFLAATMFLFRFCIYMKRIIPK